MRIYDISQELFSGAVYKGDPVPAATPLLRINRGDSYNLSSISLCVHNGTHIDAPAHCFDGAKTVDQVPLASCVGPCTVVLATGAIDSVFIKALLERGVKRIIFKGKGTLTPKAAQTLSESDVLLVGTESQTMGSKSREEEVHKVLLDKEIVLLEGLSLQEVPEGNYFLSAAPLNLGGLDGAPCRAILIDYFLH